MEEMITINTGNVVDKNKPFPIYNEKNPLLKQIMPEYTGEISDSQFQEFIEKLKFTRKAFRGVGLAANQCGIEVAVFVIGTETLDMVCINPKILTKSIESEQKEEGCLSFPHIYLKIYRPDSVEVEYTNQRGKVIKEMLTGITARCFQHEYDHLNGISIVDHVGKTSMMMAKKKKEKIVKKIQRNRR